MDTSRNIWIFGIGILVAGIGLWTTNRPSASVEVLIKDAASHQLERPVALAIELTNKIDNWVFICGSITEADGTKLNIETTNTEAEYESGAFCALANTQDMSQLSEFDFGSTDMPAMDWLDRYNLDPSILTSGER